MSRPCLSINSNHVTSINSNKTPIKGGRHPRILSFLKMNSLLTGFKQPVIAKLVEMIGQCQDWIDQVALRIKAYLVVHPGEPIPEELADLLASFIELETHLQMLLRDFQ